MPLLASDLMNTQFVGARNPDELMAVEFFMGTVKDMRGRPVLEKDGAERKVPYVRISIPGNDTSMVVTPVRPEHQKRFPRQWQFWQMEQADSDGGEVLGWKIEDWEELNDEQRRELKYLRFSVVEQIAQASDAQIQRMQSDGMSLRVRARKALAQKADDERAQERALRDAKIDELQAQIAGLTAQFKALSGADTGKAPTKADKTKAA